MGERAVKNEPDQPKREMTQAEWAEKMKDPQFLARQIEHWRASHTAVVEQYRKTTL